MAKDPRTAVALCTRGNPNKLTMTLMSFLGTAARPGQIDFLVRADDDDSETLEALHRLQREMNLHVYVGPRPVSMGHELNCMIKEHPDCDFYSIINDDVIPLTWEWDTGFPMGRYKGSIIGQAFYGCWNQTLAPTPDYPIFSREYLDVCDDQVPFTDLFPFWFDDMWASCVAMYVYGRPLNRLSLDLGVRKTKVTRMRDLVFWWKFYGALEPARRAQAQRMCDRLELDVDVERDRKEFFQQMEDGVQKRIIEAPLVEEQAGEHGPAPQFYLEAKQNAERLLQHLGIDVS